MNCGHTNEMKVWSSQLHCDCYLSNFLLQLSPKNVFGVSTQFEPMASALAQQCSTNWARKTHTLGAGQFIEFITYPWKEWNIWILCELRTYKWNEGVIIAVVIAIFGALLRLLKSQSQLRWSHLHGYDEFNKLACSQLIGHHSSVGGALQR